MTCLCIPFYKKSNNDISFYLCFYSFLFSQTVAELKQLILFKFSGESLSPDSTRLRVEDDNLGLQPPRKYYSCPQTTFTEINNK